MQSDGLDLFLVPNDMYKAQWTVFVLPSPPRMDDAMVLSAGISDGSDRDSLAWVLLQKTADNVVLVRSRDSSCLQRGW